MVPIATEHVYAQRWIGRAQSLGLQWIPLFHAGQSVHLASLSEVAMEFEAMERSFASSGAPELASRAAEAAGALREALEAPVGLEVFIG